VADGTAVEGVSVTPTAEELAACKAERAEMEAHAKKDHHGQKEHAEAEHSEAK